VSVKRAEKFIKFFQAEQKRNSQRSALGDFRLRVTKPEYSAPDTHQDQAFPAKPVSPGNEVLPQKSYGAEGGDGS